jgi:carbon-monoxide dehydrogenase medium subunit
MGTIGGSVAHADPAAELPAAMLALDASFVVVGPGGARTIPADAFFLGPFTSSLETGEILREIHVPVSDGQRSAFAEVAVRHGDFALGGVAAVLQNGRVRLAALGLGWTPISLNEAASIASEGALTPDRISAASAAARDEVDPPADIHADAEYRRHLAGVLVERTLSALAA